MKERFSSHPILKLGQIAIIKKRIDKFNGLLLTPNLDKALDRGYITFDKSGAIIISPQLNSPLGFGITNELSIPFNKLNQNHFEYLDYHRKKIFISEIKI